MSSLLVPVHLAAKVITEETPVPHLGGEPFAAEGRLEPGVHLHWALPDALTRARFVEDRGVRVTVFPAVPDAWLVLRFQPAPAGMGARAFRAWVVDAIAGEVKPLGDWRGRDDHDAGRVHTFAGMLESAEALGAPAWGRWDPEQTAMSAAAAAYYPAARNRFGFYDALGDLPDGAGPLTYAVVGWYSDELADPLRRTSNRRLQIERWGWAWSPSKQAAKSLKTTTVREGEPGDLAGWTPRPDRIRMQQAPLVKQQKAKQAWYAARDEWERLDSRLGDVAAGVKGLARDYRESNPRLAEILARALASAAPSRILCHGALLEVEPAAGPDDPPAVTDDQVRLYHSAKTAMAEIVSGNSNGKTRMAEALLQNLDGRLAKTRAGLVDLPGELHELSFQSAPGRGTYFAQLEIVDRNPVFAKSSDVGISQPQVGSGLRATSGHWPEMTSRAAAAPLLRKTREQLQAELRAELRWEKDLTDPAEPTKQEIDDWIKRVSDALEAAGREADGTPIHPIRVRVVDSRAKAQSPTMGRLSDGSGSGGNAYWLDTGDREAMRRALLAIQGADVGLPNVDELFEVSGSPWYRPWSPLLTITGHGCSYRFGEDGRFEQDGKLLCRVSGDTIASLHPGASKQPALGSEILAGSAALGLHPFLPAEVRALAEEAALLDPGNAAAMAQSAGASDAERAAAEDLFRSSCQALWLLRDEELDDAQRRMLVSMISGRAPSPVAFARWRDPWDPLFVDVQYAHPYSSLENDWTLEGEDGGPMRVELRPRTAAATTPPDNEHVHVFAERALVGTTMVRAIASALLTRTTVDLAGRTVPAGPAPEGYSAETFQRMGVLSASLTGFERMLFNAGRRERSGALRLNKLALVDAFGIRRSWESGVAERSVEGSEKVPWWIALPPRLPFWSRLEVRLLSARRDRAPAGIGEPVLCGMLVPDVLEHALEVYAADGRALGQVRSDRPLAPAAGEPLAVRFELHPLVEPPAGAQALDVIDNPRLRAVVAALVQQGAQAPEVPEGEQGPPFYETGLTALLRVVDTLRPAIDPRQRLDNPTIRLIGEPIAVMALQVELEACGDERPEKLLGEPVPPEQPPEIPQLEVRIGDQSRPDDGVLGCLLEHDDPAQSRFAPVDAEAAQRALYNGLPAQAVFEQAVTHPFIAGESVFSVAVGDKLDLTVLSDLGAAIHATCGALPRRKLIVPRESLAAAEGLQPTLRVGPVVSDPTPKGDQPVAPSPALGGYTAEWLRRQAPDEERITPLTSRQRDGELPSDRVKIESGWISLRPEFGQE